jgi:hypothetical protein
MSTMEPGPAAPEGAAGASAVSAQPPRRQRKAQARQSGLQLALEEEGRILSALRADLAVHHEALDDPDLMIILAEGETTLLDLVDLILELDLHDEALIAALKGNRDTMAARLHRFEERRRSRRVTLEQTLMLLERNSPERPTGTISLSDRAPSLVVDEESVVPARFFDLKPMLNRRLTKEALEAGEEIPGVRLSERVLTLTVRRR